MRWECSETEAVLTRLISPNRALAQTSPLLAPGRGSDTSPWVLSCHLQQWWLQGHLDDSSLVPETQQSEPRKRKAFPFPKPQEYISVKAGLNPCLHHYMASYLSISVPKFHSYKDAKHWIRVIQYGPILISLYLQRLYSKIRSYSQYQSSGLEHTFWRFTIQPKTTLCMEGLSPPISTPPTSPASKSFPSV